jgi:asparagine synthase (glutamine-hydrolysing)
MCGILVDFHPDGVADAAALRRGLEALRPRGPDGEGLWLSPDGTVALGHVRLAVLDPAGSPQPVASEDGSVVGVVNGEFYGHEALRAELAARGHRFRTGGDSEVVVHLYEEYGLDFVRFLRGEFAVALWDEARRRLVAARDRFGVKPLCFRRDGARLRLASQARGLFALGVAPAWDVEAVAGVAAMQYVPPQRTLFAGVQPLRPGHLLTASAAGVRTVAYWEPDFPPEAGKETADADALAERLRAELDDAVRVRLRADVPLACHLSGGLDSATVAALAAERLGRPPPCFTVGFDTPGYDETERAGATAVFLGADWRLLRLRRADLVAHLPRAVADAEGLAINLHLTAKWLLARHIRSAGFKVVLSGEGADEVLGGYAHFRIDLRAPAGAATTTGGAGGPARIDPMLTGMHVPLGAALPLDGVRSRLGFVPTFLHAKATLGHRLHTLLRADFRRFAEDRDRLAGFVDAFDVPGRLRGRHPVDQAAFLWMRSALAGSILQTLGDGTEAVHGLEGRLPFLDHRLFALVRRVPTGLKIRDDVEKWLLRRAMAGRLPAALLGRAKQPFTAPPLTLAADVASLAPAQDLLRSSALRDGSFFDAAAVAVLLDRLPSLDERERLAWDPVLMLVLTAVLLQEHFGL